MRRRAQRELISVIREQNALIERQTDRIMHLVGLDYQPTPKDTADALTKMERAREERIKREPYVSLPERLPE